MQSHLEGVFPGAYIEMPALAVAALSSKWTMLDGSSVMVAEWKEIQRDVCAVKGL